MITIFGVSLATTAPWLLLAIPVATSILIYTFRARGPGAPTVTSSLFLLSKLPDFLPARKSFTPPLQFWLELAAFLFLSLAASGLMATSVGQRIAIVIDSSTSMSALTHSQSTRLQEAKRLAQADIAKAPSTTRFAVFSALNALSKISDGVVSSSSAIDAVESVDQTHAPDTLASSVSTLLGDATYDAIWVYTDKRRQDDQGATQVRVSSVPLDSASSRNLWIHSLRVIDIERQPHLRVEVFSSDDKPARPTLSATCESESPQESFSLSAVSAPASKLQPAITTLGPLKASWSFCSLVISPDPRESVDAISLDNTAYIVSNPSSAGIVVASQLSPEVLGLTKLPEYSFSPETPQTTAGNTKTIFHRLTPRTRPSSPSLVVLPPAGPLPWMGGEVSNSSERGSMEISRWTETHPITRYTQPQLLSIPSGRVLVCPDSATPILYSQYGALLCAGEENGSRYVIVGFELFPFDGIKSPTLSVLTLNTLRWLFNEESLGNQHTPLLATFSNNQTNVERLKPVAATVMPSQRIEALQTPGVFKLTTAAGNETHVELFATNSLVDEESDIGRERTLAIEAKDKETRPTDNQDLPLERALAIAALVVLVIDLVRRLRRSGQWGSI